eukprot:scaffold6994_cov101-Isochrysis_galbana.AAC.4
MVRHHKRDGVAGARVARGALAARLAFVVEPRTPGLVGLRQAGPAGRAHAVELGRDLVQHSLSVSVATDAVLPRSPAGFGRLGRAQAEPVRLGRGAERGA